MVFLWYKEIFVAIKKRGAKRSKRTISKIYRKRFRKIQNIKTFKRI